MEQHFAPFLATHWSHMAFVIFIFGHLGDLTDSYYYNKIINNIIV